MAEQLVRLVGPIAMTGSDQTLYTVGAGVTIDLRSIRIVNNDLANSQTCKLSIGPDSAGTRILPPGTAVPASGIFADDSHTTLNAGDVLHCTGNANLTITLSGVAITP